MVESVLLWTIVAILLSSTIGVVLARRKKDPCLNDFHAYMVTVQTKNGKRVWGRLHVETSGIEFRYRDNYWDKDHVETSFILYKEEFGNIFVLFRFHDELTPEEQKCRLHALKKAYHPWPPRRLLRHIRNLFNTIRDAINEALGTAILQIKTPNPALQAMATQQKYVARLQSEVIGYLGASYDPMLERHIGTLVVLEVTRPDGVVDEHVGVFKEYSSQYLEVMDVQYLDNGRPRVCDMVVPRAHAFIRHSAEPVQDKAPEQKALTHPSGGPADQGR